LPTKARTRVPVLWLCGADAVGKSTVAWEIYASLSAQGVPVAHVDTDYLGFCFPLPGDEPSALVAANLGSMWPNFAAAGARCLIVSGIVVTAEQRSVFSSALPAGELTLCLLRASPPECGARIMRRGQVEGADTAGATSGLSIDGLLAYAERAARFAELLDVAGFADFTVETDGITVPEVARRVLAGAPGWPDLA
jgi:hypothetical protein